MIRTETKVNNTNVIIEKFSGIYDFMAEYENRPVSDTYKDHATATELQNDTYENSRQRFTGASGYPEAVEQFKNGVNVAAMKAARTAAASGMKKQIIHSVNGGRVSVPSYLSGSPSCMRRRRNMPAKTGLNIVIDMAVHCRITAEQITKAGQLIVKYVTDLENQYNVNLTACQAFSFSETKRSGKYKDAYICGIKIKDAGKPFSAARVSFCLTSAAFLRVFGFIWLTRAEGIPFSWSLGYPLSNHLEQEKEIMKAVYKNAVTISISDVIQNGERALPKLK